MFLSLQVIRLLEKELDAYKAKQAEPKPDVVSKLIRLLVSVLSLLAYSDFCFYLRRS